MRSFYAQSSNSSVFRGILTILVGCVLLFVPGLTMKTVMTMIGVMLILSGLVTMLLSIRKKGGISSRFGSVQGIFNILFGLVFIASPTAMVKIVVVFLGFIIFMLGFIQLLGAISAISRTIWGWVFLLIAVLTIIGGVFLLSNPFNGGEAILTFLGVMLILNGVSSIAMVWKTDAKSQTHKGSSVQDITYEEIE